MSGLSNTCLLTLAIERINAAPAATKVDCIEIIKEIRAQALASGISALDYTPNSSLSPKGESVTRVVAMPAEPSLALLDVGWGVCGGKGHAPGQPNRAKINTASANYQALYGAIAKQAQADAQEAASPVGVDQVVRAVAWRWLTAHGEVVIDWMEVKTADADAFREQVGAVGGVVEFAYEGDAVARDLRSAEDGCAKDAQCAMRYTPVWKHAGDGLPWQESNFACKSCGYVGRHDTHPGCRWPKVDAGADLMQDIWQACSKFKATHDANKHAEGYGLASQLMAKVSAGAKGFSSQAPKEQGWYWHWNGDEDSLPIPTSVLWCGSTQTCFVSRGQLGLNEAVYCDRYGGYWLKMSEPWAEMYATQERMDQQVAEAAQ